MVERNWEMGPSKQGLEPKLESGRSNWRESLRDGDLHLDCDRTKYNAEPVRIVMMNGSHCSVLGKRREREREREMRRHGDWSRRMKKEENKR